MDSFAHNQSGQTDKTDRQTGSRRNGVKSKRVAKDREREDALANWLPTNR